MDEQLLTNVSRCFAKLDESRCTSKFKEVAFARLEKGGFWSFRNKFSVGFISTGGGETIQKIGSFSIWILSSWTVQLESFDSENFYWKSVSTRNFRAKFWFKTTFLLDNLSWIKWVNSYKLNYSLIDSSNNLIQIAWWIGYQRRLSEMQNIKLNFWSLISGDERVTVRGYQGPLTLVALLTRMAEFA